MKRADITGNKPAVLLTKAENLRFKTDGKQISLQIMNGTIKELAFDRNSLAEWLRQFKFPVNIFEVLSSESIVSIANDYLISAPGIRLMIRLIKPPDFNRDQDPQA